MSNWIERLKEEKSELEVRINSLYEFMRSSAYQELDLTEKYLVGEQSSIMENYLSLIHDRMGRTKTSSVLKAKQLFEDAMDEHEITFHSNAEGVKAFQAAIDEYVESSKPKDEGLIERLTREMTERQRMVLPEDLKDDITQTEITPKALIVLGFEENYQGVDMGNPGYIYYTLYILDVEFISTSLEDDGPFHIMFGNNCQFSISNLRKLEDLILSLKEVS
tara:strand:- start:148 stop:807 length:660 start_codon:yes stop_codon:yes gene_type:complete